MSKTILLADDCPNDVLLVRAAFARAGFEHTILVVPDGEETLRYLKAEGQYSDRKKFPIPTLLLLDLKMPRIDGFEVLKWIRRHLEWRCLPVIILSNSYYGPDIQRAYDLGANSFLTKPADLEEYVSAVKQVGDFWLNRNLFPEPGPFVPAPTQTEADAPRLGATRTAELKRGSGNPLAKPPRGNRRAPQNGGGIVGGEGDELRSPWA